MNILFFLSFMFENIKNVHEVALLLHVSGIRV